MISSTYWTLAHPAQTPRGGVLVIQEILAHA
jgi:hypothetical protein